MQIIELKDSSLNKQVIKELLEKNLFNWSVQ